MNGDWNLVKMGMTASESWTDLSTMKAAPSTLCGYDSGRAMPFVIMWLRSVWYWDAGSMTTKAPVVLRSKTCSLVAPTPLIEILAMPSISTKRMSRRSFSYLDMSARRLQSSVGSSFGTGKRMASFQCSS